MEIIDEADELLPGHWSVVPSPLPLEVLLQPRPERLPSCELREEEGRRAEDRK